MLDRYVAQVRLLVDVLPDVATEPDFSLKGGTAANLLHRYMPRLTGDLFRVFVVYVADPLRPIDKLLAPAKALKRGRYDTVFAAMAQDSASLEALMETGQRLPALGKAAEGVVERTKGILMHVIVSLEHLAG